MLSENSEIAFMLDVRQSLQQRLKSNSNGIISIFALKLLLFFSVPGLFFQLCDSHFHFWRFAFYVLETFWSQNVTEFK
jgi:hypothetical protein